MELTRDGDGKLLLDGRLCVNNNINAGWIDYTYCGWYVRWEVVQFMDRPISPCFAHHKSSFATLWGDPIQLFLFAFTTLFFYHSSSLLHSISSISCSLATMLGNAILQNNFQGTTASTQNKCLLLKLLKVHKSFCHVRSPSESYIQT